MTQPTIAPDYYLTNFTFLVNWVLARYEDLLNPEEKQFIRQFHNVDHDSQCLLVRLCSRKGPLFRADKLQYAEIKSIPAAANHLIAAGLILREQAEIAEELEDILDLIEQLPPLNLLVETSSQKSAAIHRRRAVLCNYLAYELERREQHELALLLYQQSHLPPARERQIRLFEKQKDYASAWNLLNELLEAPANEHERQIAERMAPAPSQKIRSHV